MFWTIIYSLLKLQSILCYFEDNIWNARESGGTNENFVYRALGKYLSCWGLVRASSKQWGVWWVSGDQVTNILSPLSHIDIVTDLPLAPNCSSIIIMANSLQLSNPDISCLIKIESYLTQFIVKLFIFHQIRTESALALLLYKLLLLNWEDSKCMGEQVEKIWMEENRKKTFGR